MQKRRRVVVCVFAAQRVGNHRFAQVAIRISTCHACVHRITQHPAYDMDVLPQLHKDAGSARVLAGRHALFGGDADVVLYRGEHLLGARPGLLFPGGRYRADHVVANDTVRLHAQVGHGLLDVAGIYLAHGRRHGSPPIPNFLAVRRGLCRIPQQPGRRTRPRHAPRARRAPRG